MEKSWKYCWTTMMLFLKVICDQPFTFFNTPWFLGNFVWFQVTWDPVPICLKGTVWSKAFNLPSKINSSCFCSRNPGFFWLVHDMNTTFSFLKRSRSSVLYLNKHLGLDLRQLHFVFDNFYWHLSQNWIWHMALTHCAEGKTKFPALTWNSGGVVVVSAKKGNSGDNHQF